MSQRRSKYKGKDHNPVTSKQEHGDSSLHSYNYLFDTIHPQDSYTSSKYVRLVSSVHIAINDMMFIIGQYIIFFGNSVWRYETRIFLVSILLSLCKVVIEILSILCKSANEKTLACIRQSVIIFVMLCCTLVPHYSWDSYPDMIISILMIILVVYVCVRHDDEFDPSKSFYTNIFGNAFMHFLISSMYPIIYFYIKDQMIGDDLFLPVSFGLVLQFILSAQRVLFNSHVYANVYKYQGYWACLPPKYKTSVEGKIEQWRPNHVYSFGSVVSYDNYLITAMGYLNNVKPFVFTFEFPFTCVFEKEKTHRMLICSHICVTAFSCIQMFFQSFQLKCVVITIICIISLILLFPIHTMAFN